jgi:hypothetical protein
VSQVEVYIWGSIFLCLSLGSLLLVVYLFPKNETYKKQKADRESQKVSKITAPVSPPKPVTEVLEKTTVTSMTAASVTTQVTQPVPTPTNPPTKETQHTIQTELPKTDPSIPSIPAITVKPSVPVTPPAPPKPSGEILITSHDFLFRSKNSEVETMCREFLSKLLVIIPCKSMSIYFVKNGQFTRYIERKGDVISLYDPVTERSDVSEEVIKFLKKKLGAFSSTHADAVLPLVQGDQLFGAVKLIFNVPQKNFNINPVWSEIKSFAKFFHQAFHPTQSQDKDALYSIEHFNNILSYRVTLDISQNLTLIKVINSSDRPKVISIIGDTLKDILGKKPEIYKVSEDTVGIFLTIEGREKLGRSLAEVLVKLRKQVKTVDLCVGSVDYSSHFKFPQKWYEKALQALGEASAAGPNNYKLLVEKG